MLEQVRADSAEPVENTPMYREKLCGSLWLTAMSYMKFGKYQEAYDRLRDAMRFNPKDKNTLLGMAVLGNLVGQPGGVEACLPGLKDAGNGLMEQGLELLARTRAGEKVAWWDKLYGCAFPGLKVDSDGTIPGWKPVRRTSGGATLEN
jgi:tetratricopeptide (TPR) repeat protein